MSWTGHFLRFLEQNSLPEMEAAELARLAKKYADEMIALENELTDGIEEDEE